MTAAKLEWLVGYRACTLSSGAVSSTTIMFSTLSNSIALPPILSRVWSRTSKMATVALEVVCTVQHPLSFYCVAKLRKCGCYLWNFVAILSTSWDKRFPLQVCGRHLLFSTSSQIKGFIATFCTPENMGVAIDISLNSHAFSRLQLLPVSKQPFDFPLIM